jgi:rod shape-determining protein MreD
MPTSHNGLIIGTLFLALLLTVIALPVWLIWLRPSFVLLVLFYWVLMLEYKVEVGTAFLMGLLLDILGGTLLGAHALALVLIVYLLGKLQKQIFMYPTSQQTWVVFITSILYLGILYWIQATIGEAPNTWLFWLPALSNALLWPWLSAWISSIRRRLSAM